jgi:hypothetical protein
VLRVGDPSMLPGFLGLFIVIPVTIFSVLLFMYIYIYI